MGSLTAMLKNKIREILPLVQKPAQYLGSEFNSVHKDWEKTEVKIALAFPDSYEIGMSFLGFSILYEIINSRKDALAERVYLPASDMSGIMKENNIPLFSLESKYPVKKFDILGFTLQYELGYLNVLSMLDVAGIPKLSAERSDDDPIIIGGGPCCCNPEPVSDFFDFFVIGEAEEIIHEIIEKYKQFRHNSRFQILQEISKIEGVYVPSFYEVKYFPGGEIEKIYPKVNSVPGIIKKRTVLDLNKAHIPVRPIVPFSSIVHNRFNIEVMRGCNRGCRFCEPGYIYRTKRERSIDSIIKSATAGLKNSGYEEITLLSLSCTDYSDMKKLLHKLNDIFSKDQVSISLPSLRLDAFSVELSNYLKTVRKSGLTFAPEVASDSLLNFINKGISKDNFFDVMKTAYGGGWNLIKLYFMIGFPMEKKEDITGIVSLIRSVIKIGRDIRNKSVSVNAGITPFIPKPFTPFQWDKMDNLSSLKEKVRYLKSQLGQMLKWHNPEQSFIEGVLTRGNRKLSSVLLKVFESGYKSDEWNLSLWENAFKECSVDPGFYINRDIPFDEILPWEHIDIGIKKQFLIDERRKAEKLEVTPDCSNKKCNNCGMEEICSGGNVHNIKEEVAGSFFEAVPKTTFQGIEVLTRVRLKYFKKGEMIFLSHLDLISLFHKAFKRASLPLAYSHGFNPRPKTELCFALPVGVEGLGEYMDIYLTHKIDIQNIIAVLNAQLPEGLQVIEGKNIPLSNQSLMSFVNYTTYKIKLNENKFTEFIFDKKNPLVVEHWTKKGVKKIDVSDIIDYFDCKKENEDIFISLGMEISMQKNIRPQEIITAVFHTDDNKIKSGFWQREGLFVKAKDGLITGPWV